MKGMTENSSSIAEINEYKNSYPESVRDLLNPMQDSRNMCCGMERNGISSLEGRE